MQPSFSTLHQLSLNNPNPVRTTSNSPSPTSVPIHHVAMATAFTPYTYIQCPCSDIAPTSRRRTDGSPTSSEPEDDDRAFDPRAPRSSFSLYPLEYLMYCEDCQQIRCPRCVTEEIVTYYCPNCLFEVPSSNLKSEGNRYFGAPCRC
jgi:dynactin-4